MLLLGGYYLQDQRNLGSFLICWPMTTPIGYSILQQLLICGGKWETAVKSIKYHLRRTINEAVLIYEELTTFLIQIEAILNSKPLSLSRTIWKTHTGTFSHRRGTNYHPGAISLNSAHLKATSLAAHLATIITLLVPVVIEVSSTQTLNIKVASPLNTNQSWPH